MSVSVEVLRSHLAYTAWASKMVVEAAEGLSREELARDFGTADKTVLGTLVHIFGADRVWLARLRGAPNPPYTTDADYSMAALRKEWPVIHEGWREWASKLFEHDVTREIAYTDMRGNPWRQPLWCLILHVVNHGTHHRGQVSGFLRSMGHKPPALDLVYYYRIGQPA